MINNRVEYFKSIRLSIITALFQRFASSWGDQMEAVLANAINVFLELPTEYTLLDLRKFLVNESFRKTILTKINDEYLTQFWTVEFKIMRKQSVISILTRLDTFLRPKLVRNMMAQKGGIDIREAMNGGKILLIKLAQGSRFRCFGTGQNAYLLGSLITTKIHQAALSRQELSHDKRTPFFLYIDEFQNFVTPSMEQLLSGARKFGVGMILAHQNLRQLQTQDRNVAQSVLANAGIRVCFRVDDADAKVLATGFSHFDSRDLQKLYTGEAIVRVGSADYDCNIQTQIFERKEDANQITDRALQQTRKWYSSDIPLSKRTKEEPRKETKKTSPPKEKPKTSKQPITEKVKQNKQEKPSNPSPKNKEKSPITPIKTTQKTTEIPPKVLDDFQTKADAFIQKEAKRLAKKEHTHIQNRIQKAAHTYQFKADIEYPVKTPEGRVDVAIFAGKIKIACEVSVTNTAEYEVKNIKKCFENGFDIVLMCSQKPTHLKAIQTKTQTSLTPQQLEKTVFGNASQCIEVIHKIAVAQKPKTQTIRGYRVKVKYNKVSKQSGKNAKDMLLNTIIGAMRK